MSPKLRTFHVTISTIFTVHLNHLKKTDKMLPTANRNTNFLRENLVQKPAYTVVFDSDLANWTSFTLIFFTFTRNKFVDSYFVVLCQHVLAHCNGNCVLLGASCREDGSLYGKILTCNVLCAS